MELTPLEQQLLEALVGLRGSNNGFENDFCGEMPHEEDCQRALDAIEAAKKKGARLYCPECKKESLMTLRGDGICDDCWDAKMRKYTKG